MEGISFFTFAFAFWGAFAKRLFTLDCDAPEWRIFVGVEGEDCVCIVGVEKARTLFASTLIDGFTM